MAGRKRMKEWVVDVDVIPASQCCFQNITSLPASHWLSSWVLQSLNTFSRFISVIHTHTGLLRSLNSEWIFFQTLMPLSSYAPVVSLWFLSPPSGPISMSSSMQWSFSLNQFPAHILGVTIYWHCIISTILSFNQSLWPQFPIILPELLPHSRVQLPFHFIRISNPLPSLYGLTLLLKSPISLLFCPSQHSV